MNTRAKLTKTLNDREITPEQDAMFLYAFQQSVLLALKECSTLTQAQFQYAAEHLKEQYLSVVRSQTMNP